MVMFQMIIGIILEQTLIEIINLNLIKRKKILKINQIEHIKIDFKMETEKILEIIITLIIMVENLIIEIREV